MCDYELSRIQAAISWYQFLSISVWIERIPPSISPRCTAWAASYTEASVLATALWHLSPVFKWGWCSKQSLCYKGVTEVILPPPVKVIVHIMFCYFYVFFFSLFRFGWNPQNPFQNKSEVSEADS